MQTVIIKLFIKTKSCDLRMYGALCSLLRRFATFSVNAVKEQFLSILETPTLQVFIIRGRLLDEL
jgi:hypothetical protein